MTFLYLFFSFTLYLTTSYAAEWCYDIEKTQQDCKGPDEWSVRYNTCGMKKQSPINIVTCTATFNSDLKPFTFEGYEKESNFELQNNGHSAKLSINPETYKISGGGLSGTYKASQLHFHWGSEGKSGSEHSLNGVKYLIELHIVHEKEGAGRSEPSGGSTESGSLAVLGFFFKEGKENANYKELIKGLNQITYTGNTTTIKNLKLKDLIPEKEKLKLFYRYEGSLTTPECDETVTWTVFPEIIELSKEQINEFYTSLKYTDGQPMIENFRPLQNPNERIILTSGVDALLPITSYLLISLFVLYIPSIS
ncbi:carbonic anhydrase 4 [Leptodactylus fuscus]|uniref:carbonic anhydrase 4 n=1 Tax=Leptodactylus fuscus TaxID=238119 RepID=UPI003F4EBC25